MNLYLKPSVTNGVRIEWGDGSTTTLSSTSVANYSHDYAETGDYKIKIFCT